MFIASLSCSSSGAPQINKGIIFIRATKNTQKISGIRWHFGDNRWQIFLKNKRQSVAFKDGKRRSVTKNDIPMIISDIPMTKNDISTLRRK
jgi:hypothetical protein